MNSIYLILGILLLATGIIDFIWTTLWVDRGAGPVTNRLTTFIWTSLRKLSNDNPRFLSLSGPLILTFTLLTWISLLWAGWTFVFAGSENSLIDTQEGGPVTLTERAYFAGYLIFTLGNGELSPKDGIWQIVTVIATGTGMLFITLGVTYLLSVLGAVTARRSFSQSIFGIGKDGKEIVKTAWNGTDYHNIDLFLNTYAAQLSTLSAQHNAYPVLHYYRTQKNTQALSVAVATFDEALTIFRFGIPEKYRPNSLLIQEARSSVESYLATFDSASIQPAENSPPFTDLQSLRLSGLPVNSDETYQTALIDLDKRRKKLLGAIEVNAREWPGREK